MHNNYETSKTDQHASADKATFDTYAAQENHHESDLVTIEAWRLEDLRETESRYARLLTMVKADPRFSDLLEHVEEHSTPI